MSKVYVRMTVAGHPSKWKLTPTSRGSATLLTASRPYIVRHDSEIYTTLREVELGTRKIEELKVIFRIDEGPFGGYFGQDMLEAFNATVDLERGVLVFNECGSPANPP